MCVGEEKSKKLLIVETHGKKRQKKCFMNDWERNVYIWSATASIYLHIFRGNIFLSKVLSEFFIIRRKMFKQN